MIDFNTIYLVNKWYGAYIRLMMRSAIIEDSYLKELKDTSEEVQRKAQNNEITHNEWLIEESVNLQNFIKYKENIK